MVYDTVIIGAGASGLAAAAFSKGRTLVLEKQARPGVKVLASGGGRCNVTRAEPIDRIMARFGRFGRFASDALRIFPPEEIRAFLRRFGVETAEEDGCRVFPASGKSSDVVSAFVSAARESGSEIVTGIRAVNISAASERGLRAVSADGKSFHARKVIICSGGYAKPSLGADGAMLNFLSGMGVPVSPVCPALCPLKISDPETAGIFSQLSGSGCPQVEICAGHGAQTRGPMLFTHTGISGPAVLDISGQVSEFVMKTGRDAVLKLSFLPSVPRSEMPAIFDRWRMHHGARSVRGMLSGLGLSDALSAALCGLCGIPRETKVSGLTSGCALALADLCCGMKIPVRPDGGWEQAMVMRGGVSLKAVNPKTLELRNFPGIRCAGEILNLDGPCGGFNLTWAIASGRLAAQA